MINGFRHLVLKIRPYIIKQIQDRELEEYTKLYRQNNGGNNPTQENINHFIMMLVTNGSVAKEADEIIDEFVKEFERKIKQNNIKKIIFNTTFLILISTLSLNYIFLFLSETCELTIINKSFLMGWPNFSNAVILLFVFIVSYVIHLFRS